MPTGAIPVTDPAGATIGSLTIGAPYTIRNTGGPWNASGATQPHYFFDLSDDGVNWYGPIADGTHVLPPWASSYIVLDAQHTLVQFNAPTTSVRIRVHDDPANFGDNTGSMGYDLEPASLTYCQYGTEANPDAVFYETVTDTLIDLVVGAALAGTANVTLIPYVETALLAIEGSIFLAVDCSTLPGAGPTLDFPSLSTISPDTLRAWFQNAAWRFFCRCVPASGSDPAPLSPPTGAINPPTTIITNPAPAVCDNSDLCSYLEAMKLELQSIAAQLSYLRTDVRLISHQHVPFDYLTGAVHSGLTGNGDFAVSAILAVSVQLTTMPYALGTEAGDPTAYFQAGWIASGTADGFRLSTPVRHNPQWIDVQFDDTIIGYSLPPGAVAEITEFSRSP
jgi:hypothetical protein